MTPEWASPSILYLVPLSVQVYPLFATPSQLIRYSFVPVQAEVARDEIEARLSSSLMQTFPLEITFDRYTVFVWPDCSSTPEMIISP